MKQLKIFAVVVLALLITSCIKNEDDATGVGDVLVITRKSGTATVYGLSLFAYTYSNFKSVFAVNSAEPGKTYTLKANQGYKTNFYFETPDADFTPTKPVASSFNFSAVFENGATQEFQDILSDKVLLPAIIDTCQYNTTKHMLRVSWTGGVTDADSYAINILDGSDLVFGSTQLVNTVKSYSISANGGGWAAGFTPTGGKTYTVKVYAFLYEPEGTAYNVQALSEAETTVVWGD